jgi:protein-S-isoprenylcysteine O-methyltransferase Ste14
MAYPQPLPARAGAAHTRPQLLGSMPKVFLRLVADAARTVSAAIAYPVNPALLRERAGLPLHVDQPSADRLLLLGVLVTGFLGLPAIAGLDRFHWHLLPRPAGPLGAAGLLIFTLGWGIKGLALRANAFATAAVRWQPERNHVVVETGPYAVVRHPFLRRRSAHLLGAESLVGVIHRGALRARPNRVDGDAAQARGTAATGRTPRLPRVREARAISAGAGPLVVSVTDQGAGLLRTPRAAPISDPRSMAVQCH